MSKSKLVEDINSKAHWILIPKIEKLTQERDEAREWIQKHHDEWQSYSPAAHNLRKLFPWLISRNDIRDKDWL